MFFSLARGEPDYQRGASQGEKAKGKALIKILTISPAGLNSIDIIVNKNVSSSKIRKRELETLQKWCDSLVWLTNKMLPDLLSECHIRYP